MIDEKGLWRGGKCPWWRPHKWVKNPETFRVDHDTMWVTVRQCSRCGWPGVDLVGVRGDWRPEKMVVIDDGSDPGVFTFDGYVDEQNAKTSTYGWLYEVWLSGMDHARPHHVTHARLFSAVDMNNPPPDFDEAADYPFVDHPMLAKFNNKRVRFTVEVID